MTQKFDKRQAIEDLQRKREKQARKLMKQRLREQELQQSIEALPENYIGDVLDCACVIHGKSYDWSYVEKLYNMLNRNSTKPIRLHVYTEHSRSVPPHMIKHNLEEWDGISGPKASWWYKMQLFNQMHHRGPLLYFDLDIVIVRNIDWISQLPTKYFWAIKDFRHLWQTMHYGINSSVMWWDTRRFHYLWEEFAKQPIMQIKKKYHGDQDYISAHISDQKRRTFEQKYFMSWRWEALDGGLNFNTRVYKNPNSGTKFNNETSILVFHGSPKPHEINDPEIAKFWF